MCSANYVPDSVAYLFNKVLDVDKTTIDNVDLSEWWTLHAFWTLMFLALDGICMICSLKRYILHILCILFIYNLCNGKYLHVHSIFSSLEHFLSVEVLLFVIYLMLIPCMKTNGDTISEIYVPWCICVPDPNVDQSSGFVAGICDVSWVSKLFMVLSTICWLILFFSTVYLWYKAVYM